MNKSISIYNALQEFAAAVTAKMTQLTIGEPEDQVRGPFENLMADVAAALGWNVVCTGETPLPGRLGRPDYAVHLNQLLAGYVELKAPGVGAISTRFKGHNRDQFKRFSAIPNILYTDGNEWALYRSGELVDKVVRLSGDVAADGKKAAASQDAHALEAPLARFLLLAADHSHGPQWQDRPQAFRRCCWRPLCRMLRDDVTDALKDPDSPLVQLAKDWRQLLFPDASDEQFADAYAQTVTFALLLGRSEGADPLTLDRRRSSPGRRAQPSVPRPASTDRPQRARRDGRFARSASARHRCRAAGHACRTRGPLALLLRGLSGRLRSQSCARTSGPTIRLLRSSAPRFA